MKRGTPEHPKAKRLARALKINRAWAIGILEALWHWAGKYAPQGDIGRFADDDISDAVYWEKQPNTLIDALIDCGWLERDDTYRLIIHDWHDHADDAVKKCLSRGGLDFVTHRDSVGTVSGQCPDKNCLPEPSLALARARAKPEPPPRRRQPPSPSLFVFPSGLSRFDTPEVQDAGRRWVAHLAAKGKPCLDPALTVLAAVQCYGDPSTFCEQVNRAIAGNWANLQQPEPKRQGANDADGAVTRALDSLDAEMRAEEASRK